MAEFWIHKTNNVDTISADDFNNAFDEIAEQLNTLEDTLAGYNMVTQTIGTDTNDECYVENTFMGGTRYHLFTSASQTSPRYISIKLSQNTDANIEINGNISYVEGEYSYTGYITAPVLIYFEGGSVQFDELKMADGWTDGLLGSELGSKLMETDVKFDDIDTTLNNKTDKTYVDAKIAELQAQIDALSGGN